MAYPPAPPQPSSVAVITAQDTEIRISLSGGSTASTLFWGPGAAPAHGIATLASDTSHSPAHTNTVLYTPTAAYVGGDSFTYAVNDGINPPVSATVTVTVSATLTTYDGNFVVLLTDAAELAEAQATYPNGIYDAPDNVAATYDIPVPLGINNTGDTILIFGGGGGNAGLTEAIPSVIIPAGFVVDSYYNLVAFASAPGGILRWHGTFQRRGGPAPGTKEQLQTHRWMVGFERANGGENLTGAASQRMSRDASRTLDGMGLALRSAANEIVSMSMPTTGTGFPTRDSWERLYVRVRKYPTANEMFWGVIGGGQAGTAGLLAVTPAGSIQFYNKGNQAFPGTAVGSAAGTLPLNQWVKLDIIYGFALFTTQKGYCAVFINGVMVLLANVNSGADGGGGLISTIQTQVSSRVGNENTPSTGLEIDIDDWTNKTQPLLYTGDDWLQGTHIYPLGLTGFGSGHSAAWVGDFRTLDGTPVNGQVDVVTTSTANALMEVETDYKDRQAGCSGIQMNLFHANASSTSETLGVEFEDLSTNQGTVTTATASWSTPTASTAETQRIYTSGNGSRTEGQNHGTVKLFYARDAVASLRNVNLLYAEAEYIGLWGPEDQGLDGQPLAEFPARQSPHNSPFYDSIFGQGADSFSIGPVNVYSGTYTGNGTGQDISTKVPMHWIWIRPLTGGTGGARWWSSCLAGHDPLLETPNKGNLIRCYEVVDADGVPTDYKFRVSGLNANSNENGVVYQWCGFSDRAMRYCMNGAYLTASATASFTHNTFKATFLPLAGFLLPELGTNAATKGMYFKGTGHAADAASLMDAAESASVCAFAAGALTPKTILNLASSQTAYNLWRILDGGGTSAGIAITNYTGDGTGARNIALSLGGRKPLFALVQPADGVAYQRDPSHTGSNSNAINSSGAAPSTTAITAGTVDQITVGATLNALAVVYSVFVIPGTVGGSGWEPNPTDPIILVDPEVPPEDDLPPGSMNGWWKSDILFTGAADIETLRPHDARDWQKINLFATGNAGAHGGFPGPGASVNNFFYYAGNDYQVGGTQPTIRVFDGLSDRLMITIPDVAGVKALAIMSMLAVNKVIYLTTLDSGTSASDWAGRVFEFDPISLTLTQLGSQFTTGNVPYALAWHMGRLWLGGNKGSGAISSVYWFLPGIDTAWTTDRTLTADGVGGVTSMMSYQGKLYVGCNATAAMGTNKILVRDSLGAWSTSYTAVSAGTFRASNGFMAMRVFNDKLYASYWNPDTVADCYVKQLNGATGAWTTVYSGTGNTLRPFIALFEAQKTLFILGGGSGLSACLVSSPDGNVWTNLTAFLTGPTTSTALPIVGQRGAQ